MHLLKSFTLLSFIATSLAAAIPGPDEIILTKRADRVAPDGCQKYVRPPLLRRSRNHMSTNSMDGAVWGPRVGQRRLP